MPESKPCDRCEGGGQLANSDDREPWSYWESLPPGSDLAVQLGLVQPEPCDVCDGKGTVPVAEPVVAAEPVAEPLITVYVSIGNSDNDLTQRGWAEFIRDFRRVMRRHATQVYGEWYSAPDVEFQNACMAIALRPGSVDVLRGELTEMRSYYDQDSVAWAVVGETEFI